MHHATPPVPAAPGAGIDCATDTDALCVADPDGPVVEALLDAGASWS
jgi:hypothetical protein